MTEYVVLKMADERELLFAYVGETKAGNNRSAIGKVAKETGEYVAVPKSSFKLERLELKTVNSFARRS